MYSRTIAPRLTKSLKDYPILTLLGPRQSGKTTLIRHVFPEFEYKSLEDPDMRLIAKEDPRSFLNSNNTIILDEVQRVPELTSYIQTIVDTSPKKKFILTGSNGTLLMDSITQTLAGRTELFELHPFSVSEILNIKPEFSLNDFLFTGGFPRIHDKNLNPTDWLKNYFRLYIEKDIRLLTNISNIDQFERFVRLAAGRVGQLINASSLANEVGVSSNTISSWMSALKTTFISFTLSPHFKNFNIRIVKTPKLYFYDTGLLCYLLGINSPEQLNIHPLRGNIFENFIISEIIKKTLNSGRNIEHYFWRDQKGHEIDIVEDRSSDLFPIEIKLSSTFNSSFIKNIEYLNKLQNKEIKKNEIIGKVIYTGDLENIFKNIKIQNWKTFLTHF